MHKRRVKHQLKTFHEAVILDMITKLSNKYSITKSRVVDKCIRHSISEVDKDKLLKKRAKILNRAWQKQVYDDLLTAQLAEATAASNIKRKIYQVSLITSRKAQMAMLDSAKEYARAINDRKMLHEFNQFSKFIRGTLSREKDRRLKLEIAQMGVTRERPPGEIAEDGNPTR